MIEIMDGRTIAGPVLAAMLAGCGGAPPATNVTANAAGSMTAAPAPTATPTLAPAPAGTPLTLAPPSPRADRAAAFVAGKDGWTPILYLCDGVDGSQVAAVSATTLRTFAKPGMSATMRTIALGAEDAGAGSIWRDMTRGGETVGAVRSINPGMLGMAEATTLPTLSSVRLGDRETRCRWLPRARLLIVAPRRSAIVTREADGSYTYRSFDYARPGPVSEGGEAGTSSTPTVDVRGGRLIAAPAGQEIYEFSAAPWVYRVAASARTGAPGASVTVLKDGREVSRAEAITYEMAAARVD
ncbi:hypothetical protein ASE86_04770 [Sphingomonas sp. Leaf33]|uniref:hypothetical protein n=1 Tax=Sphingomonas sp. Leaf33 TaxID=1736215 RepID=UPI0006F6260E|nr:hypothetical protein [Sphingomonas sp. Leaf33]KQN25541.1 hypothetical protein ASE86_04770 [Sphingomonas sp. Leaf33]